MEGRTQHGAPRGRRQWWQAAVGAAMPVAGNKMGWPSTRRCSPIAPNALHTDLRLGGLHSQPHLAVLNVDSCRGCSGQRSDRPGVSGHRRTATGRSREGGRCQNVLDSNQLSEASRFFGCDSPLMLSSVLLRVLGRCRSAHERGFVRGILALLLSKPPNRRWSPLHMGARLSQMTDACRLYRKRQN